MQSDRIISCFSFIIYACVHFSAFLLVSCQNNSDDNTHQSFLLFDGDSADVDGNITLRLHVVVLSSGSRIDRETIMDNTGRFLNEASATLNLRGLKSPPTNSSAPPPPSVSSPNTSLPFSVSSTLPPSSYNTPASSISGSSPSEHGRFLNVRLRYSFIGPHRNDYGNGTVLDAMINVCDSLHYQTAGFVLVYDTGGEQYPAATPIMHIASLFSTIAEMLGLPIVAWFPTRTEMTVSYVMPNGQLFTVVLTLQPA